MIEIQTDLLGAARAGIRWWQGTPSYEKILKQNSEKFFNKCLISGKTYDSTIVGRPGC